MNLDAVDLALLEAMNAHPGAGPLELSRHAKVARATVTARLKKMEDAGVIAGYVPHIDLSAAGFGVQAFVTLEIAQGALDRVTAELEAVPGVLEAFATTGSGDVLCRIAAASHQDLQATLLQLNRAGIANRSTSVMVLSVVTPFRSMPLMRTLEAGQRTKAPAYRGGER
ncbi:DNA-binding Lrp family transcriptional regulator [Rhodococcus sp. 27YEA15]|uniref:Lrp/AsnC family transcriptional regulator n=1 Tax=Rhodococcus sp. 27YEA15 TaxID=3156259 RepID=UPI003C7AAD7A